ncbi:MAG: GntR family transcriptional regulator [Anderseniella sp.]|nr:GntR family transcriptional regulator [Anderseniella sp.]
MNLIQTAPALAEQVYQAILDEICSGNLAPGTHLKQEQLAERLGVSRQPVQQAMALLKADGLVEEIGKRGLRVSHLDIATMQHHYEIRGLLDGLAAHNAARRMAADGAARKTFEKQMQAILTAGRKAVSTGNVPEMVRQDEAFHRLFYATSGNPLLAHTAEPHWRFLRRVMGDVLRHAEPPHEIWDQHEAIARAALDGNAGQCKELMAAHTTRAATLLSDNAPSPTVSEPA